MNQGSWVPMVAAALLVLAVVIQMDSTRAGGGLVASVESPLEVQGGHLEIEPGAVGEVLTAAATGVVWKAATLPGCSDAEPLLQWRAGAFRCAASERTSYWGFANSIAATDLAVALQATLDGTDNPRVTSTYQLSQDYNTGFYLQASSNAGWSYMLALTPTWTEWYESVSAVSYRGQSDPPGDDPYEAITLSQKVLRLNHLLVNGVSYDLSAWSLSTGAALTGRDVDLAQFRWVAQESENTVEAGPGP